MKYDKPRFLMIPELGQGGQWKIEQILDHPMFKGGPFICWVTTSRAVWPRQSTKVNRELFYAEMRGKMEMETDG